MAIPLWMEGITDAIGFVAGAAIGFGVGQLTGCDIFSPGYGISTIVGIALVGLGGGIGLQLARAWRIRQSRSRDMSS